MVEIEVPVRGQNLPVAANRYRADKKVRRTPCNSFTSTFVAHLRGVFIIANSEKYILERSEGLLDTLILSFLSNANERFKTDNAKDFNLAIVDGGLEQVAKGYIGWVEMGPLASESERKDAAIDQNHSSFPTCVLPYSRRSHRSRWCRKV